MSRYLVTGASGFLGRALVFHLLEVGHEVVALVRSPHPPLAERGAMLALGDVCDPASVQAAAEGVAGVFHCAGHVSRSLEDTEALYRVHVQGTRSVLEAAHAAGVPRVVCTSTSGTVAISRDPSALATEDTPVPLSFVDRWPYYRAKWFAEKVAMEMQRPGFDVVLVNPSLLLGPGDTAGTSTGDLRAFLDGKVPCAPPGGLSFVDVRDAAYGMLLAMQLGESGRRYLLGACNLTFADLFARVARLAGRAAPWVTLPVLPSWVQVFLQGLKCPVDPISWEMGECFWYLDADRARTELGWSPRDPDVTLAAIVADLLSSGS